jgi:hypothetical protein
MPVGFGKAGRPKSIKLCPWCSGQMGAREFRWHEPNCTKRPQRRV